MTLLSVVWHDAYFELDEPNDGYKPDYWVTTVGFVVEETEVVLRIAAEKLPRDDGYRAITSIPKPAIRSRSVLEHASTPVSLHRTAG